jgi:DNA-binding beta-propeller fold protein YncE
MDRQLRDLLDAAVGEPPHRVSVDAVRRRVIRRRVLGCVAGAAAVAIIAAAVPLGIGALGRDSRPSATGSMAAPTVYVLSGGIQDALTPVHATANTPGRPIPLGPDLGQPQVMAITPDGKTIYVTDGTNSVAPVSTVTNTAGKPISIGEQPDGILITPDGKTAYVLGGSGTLTPISTATNTPGKAVSVGMNYGGGDEMAITPDGKTLYVISFPHPGKNAHGPAYVLPVSTATNTPGKPIKIGLYQPQAIVMSPDGQTAYVVGLTIGGQSEVIPIATATNAPGHPVATGPVATARAITPDGQTLYLADGSGSAGVIPFATATNTPGKLIRFSGGVVALAVTPDGKTAYVSSSLPSRGPSGTCTGTGDVTPIPTATNVPGRPIRVGCHPTFLAITPDGKTVWVGTVGRVITQYQHGKPIRAFGEGTITPISTATNTAGKPIKIDGAITGIAVTP